MTIFRRGPAVYVSKAGSGITRPEDFAGRAIQVSTVDTANFQAMMSRAAISPAQYRVVNLQSDVKV